MSLRRFAQLTLGYVLLVIVWGGYVRASGAGAGCGRHWPLCNGELIPQSPSTKTLIELGHRITSGLSLVLVGALVIWAYRARPAGHRMRRAATWSLAFLIVEALIGALLVKLELVGANDSMLRAGYLAGHLANTFVLLAFLTLAVLWAEDPGPRSTPTPGPRLVGWLALGGILVVAMSGAVTALGDTLFPAESLAAGLRQDTSPTSHFLLRLRVIHPALAVAVAVLTIFFGYRAASRGEDHRTHRAGRWLIGLTLIQLGVGVVNLALLVPIATQLLHLLVADLLWIAAVGVAWGRGRLDG
jgi:heme A synthase